MTKLTIDLVDEIDVGNWTIDDYEEPKDFQANPPSFDVKQALILEKKQDVNVVFKSLLVEDDIMEIHLCHIISMQVVRHALMNDILKLRRDFYSCITLELQYLMFILNGLMDALLMSTKRGQTIGMIIGMQWMKNLKHIYNPNFLCITSWERCSMFGMEIIDSKLVIDKSMRYMRKTNQGIHVWVTSWVFDANMDNHGALQSIMDGVNVWIQLLSPLILFVCDTKIIHQIFMLFFYGHIGQWKGHMWR